MPLRERAVEAAKSITAAEIKAEALERAKNERWKRFMDVERADLVIKGPNLSVLVLNGAEIGEIARERIEGDPHHDAEWTIKLPDLRASLRLNEGELRKAVEELRGIVEGIKRAGPGEDNKELEADEKLWRLGARLGDKAFGAAAVRYYKEGRAKIAEGAFMLASALERQLRAMFGEVSGEIVEGVWYEIRWLDGELQDHMFKAMKEGKWDIHTVDKDVDIVDEKLPQYREYIKELKKVAEHLKAAARELVEGAEREGKGGVKWINGRPYIAYEGPVELSVQVEHMTRGEKTYAVIEVKYGERTARVELEVEKYRRSALSHNLAAIATDDKREFYKGYVSHRTASFVQATERLLMWALFMPGEYKITVRYVHATEEGLSPLIEISSRFGWGGLEKIERESPIHRLVLRLAKELAGGEKPNVGKVLAASWIAISAILSTPEGKKPSEGLAVLVEKGVLPRAAFDRLKPILEELDALLGTVSRVDKAYLVGKMVDYDGYIKEGLLRVKAEAIKKISIELDGVKIRMADVALAAAKALSEKGGWSGDKLSFGPAEDVPLKIVDVPAFKAMAALMAQKADELRRKDLVKYVELRSYKIDGGEIKITPAKAKGGGERTLITQLEEIWREFKIGKYTHLRLVVRGEEYELFYSGGIFGIKGEGAQKLKRALEELKLEARLTSDGRLYLGYERLEALLSAGVKAYAVRKAKRGEAMWRLEITYRGVTMELKMTYHERNNCLVKGSRTGKIEVDYKDAAKSEQVELDLGLLAAAGGNCKDCLEKRLVKAFTIASEKLGLRWSVTSDRKYLYVYLPSDFRDVVRRFYSNI